MPRRDPASHPLMPNRGAPCVSDYLDHASPGIQCCATVRWGEGDGQHVCISLPAHPVQGYSLPGRRFHLFEHCGGSVTLFAERVSSGGLPYVLDFLPWPSVRALQYILAFGAIQAFLHLVLPGRTFHGPVTPMGNTPVYKVGSGRLLGPGAPRGMWPVPCPRGGGGFHKQVHAACMPFLGKSGLVPSALVVRCFLLRTDVTIWTLSSGG